MKILALGAHFDDIEIGCGGTLKQHTLAGDEVYVMIFNPNNERSGSSDIRLIEQQTALFKLGIPNENLHLVNTLDEDKKIEHMVADIDAIKADIIFLPYWNDSHQHHRRVNKLGQAALRKRHITGYQFFSGSSIEFQPNVYNIIDAPFKFALLHSFTSQEKNRSLNIDLIMDYNKYCGSVISNDLMVSAEAFHVKRMRYKA